MYRLFPCVPIFRGFFFLLKVQKECVYVIMLKIALVLVKSMFFSLKKGISRLAGWVAQKNTAVAQKHNMKGYTIEDKTLATQQNCDSIYS